MRYKKNSMNPMINNWCNKSELLYQCKLDNEDTGNQYIRRITINYDDPVTIYDMFNVYRDLYGCLYEFIEEGEKTCKLIQIFNDYEKPIKIYKEYIDKNFEFCMSVFQKVIPMYTTESESYNFLLKLKKFV